jgi:hypothetical protein
MEAPKEVPQMCSQLKPQKYPTRKIANITSLFEKVMKKSRNFEF